METNTVPQPPKLETKRNKLDKVIYALVGSAVAVLVMASAYYMLLSQQAEQIPDVQPPQHIGTPVQPDTLPEQENVQEWVGASWNPELVKQEDDCQTAPYYSPQNGETEYCGDNISNYLAGTITSGPYLGEKLYLMQASEMGTYYDHYVYVDSEKIYFQDKIGIRGIDDVPDEIDFQPKPGYKLKEGWIGQELFEETTLVRKLFTHPQLGDFYLSSDGCIVTKLPDHTVLSYDFKLSFVNEENGTVDFTINSVPNREPYDFRRPTCVANCYYWSVVSEEKLKPETRLVIVGTTATGENTFALSDQNDQALRDIYYDEMTVAYLNEDGSWPPMDHSKYTYEEFLALNPLLYWKDPLDRWIEFRNRKTAVAAEMCKPVVYLYPESIKNVQVSVAPNGGFTHTEPPYQNGWNVIASPGGKLFDLGTWSFYDYLLWEGIGLSYPKQDEGFVVSREALQVFLDEKLAILGLRGKEITDFESYWLGRLTDKPYYKISFINKASFDQIASLSVSDTPDTIIRVMMTARGLDEPVQVTEQALGKTPTRHGFVVVEWGGALLK